MRNLNELNEYRDFENEMLMAGTYGDQICGVFKIKLDRTTPVMTCIASTDGGWDHVSVSNKKGRCPTWDEMKCIKELFFKPDEWAIQYNPPPDENISRHNYVLHLWRPQQSELPVPPRIFV